MGDHHKIQRVDPGHGVVAGAYAVAVEMNVGQMLLDWVCCAHCADCRQNGSAVRAC